MEACVAQKSTSRSFNRERWFVLKIPRGDTNGVGEYEVTVTSGLTHKQKEQRNRKEKRRLHAKEAQTKTQNQRIVLHFRYIRHERPWPTT